MLWALDSISTATRFTGEYGAAIVGVPGIVALWSSLLWPLSLERQAAIDNASVDTNNHTRAFQEQITGIARTIDQTLVRVRYIRAPEQFDIGPWCEDGEVLANPALPGRRRDMFGLARTWPEGSLAVASAPQLHEMPDAIVTAWHDARRAIGSFVTVAEQVG